MKRVANVKIDKIDSRYQVVRRRRFHDRSGTVQAGSIGLNHSRDAERPAPHQPPASVGVYASLSRGVSAISMRHFNFVGSVRLRVA